MRTKVTLVLLLLNVVLFFIIFRVERLSRTESLALEVRRRVLGAEAADIRVLAVDSAVPGGSYRLERRGADWYLTEPWEWRANPNAVGRLISDLQFLDNETSFSVSDVEKNGQHLADYGLDPPALSVGFSSGGVDTTGQAPTITTLKIGSATKVGQRLYVLSPDGSRINVVSRTLLDGLALPVERLRSDDVLTIPEFEARGLNLQVPSGSRILIQRDGPRWTFETPISARASQAAMAETLTALHALRVQSFAPTAVRLSDAAALRVTVEGDNRHETLFLSAEADARGESAAQLENLAQPGGRSVPFTVVVPVALREVLANAVERLRDRHVLDLDPATVTALTLEAPGAPELDLRRLEPAAGAGASATAGWQILLPAKAGQGPRTLGADAGRVRELLGNLAELSAHQFVSDAPTAADLEKMGFNQPARRIILSQVTAGGPQSVSLEIAVADPRDPLVNVRVTPAPSVYAVNPDVLLETPTNARHWRDRQLRAPDAARIVGLALVDLSDGAVKWSWPSLNQSAARAAAGQSLAADLLNLRARDFVADRFDAAGADGKPWRYRLDATLALPGGGSADTPSEHSLYLGERTGAADQLAGSAEFDAVFLPEQRLIDEIWGLTNGERDPGAPATPVK